MTGLVELSAAFTALSVVVPARTNTTGSPWTTWSGMATRRSDPVARVVGLYSAGTVVAEFPPTVSAIPPLSSWGMSHVCAHQMSPTLQIMIAMKPNIRFGK